MLRKDKGIFTVFGGLSLLLLIAVLPLPQALQGLGMVVGAAVILGGAVAVALDPT